MSEEGGTIKTLSHADHTHMHPVHIIGKPCARYAKKPVWKHMWGHTRRARRGLTDGGRLPQIDRTVSCWLAAHWRTENTCALEDAVRNEHRNLVCCKAGRHRAENRETEKESTRKRKTRKNEVTRTDEKCSTKWAQKSRILYGLDDIGLRNEEREKERKSRKQEEKKGKRKEKRKRKRMNLVTRGEWECNTKRAQTSRILYGLSCCEKKHTQDKNGKQRQERKTEEIQQQNKKKEKREEMKVFWRRLRSSNKSKKNTQCEG